MLCYDTNTQQATLKVERVYTPKIRGERVFEMEDPESGYSAYYVVPAGVICTVSPPKKNNKENHNNER